MVRPLLATDRLSHAVSPLPPVEEIPGGAAASVPSGWRVPNSRMLPFAFTAPELTWAMAASALVVLDLSESQLVSEPTGVVPAPSPLGVQLLSMSPGWIMASPTAAWSLRASTWLLLSRYRRLLESWMSAPSVPLQQSTI